MTDKEQIKCKYKFQDKEKFDGKTYCTCFCKLCEDLPLCDDNCQIYEDFKQLARKTQEYDNLSDLLRATDVYTRVCMSCADEILIYPSISGRTSYTDNEVDAITLKRIIDTLKNKTQEFEQLQEKYEALKLENQEGYEIVAELNHECEELKEKLYQIEDVVKPINEQLPEDNVIRQIMLILNDCNRLEPSRYRNALEEIEQELKEDIYCESQECGCDDFEECLKCTKEYILDIINKVKGEKNERQ